MFALNGWQLLGIRTSNNETRKLIGYFVTDQESSFYQSPTFSKIIQYCKNNPSLVKMKEKQTRNGLRLIITFEI